MSQAPAHLPKYMVLDAARAGAALWVLAAHITLIAGAPVWLVSQGSLAVDCFIFISGFLMMLLLRREDSISRENVIDFYVRRYFRLAPAFYAAIILYGLGRGVYGDGLELARVSFGAPPAVPALDGEITVWSVALNLIFMHGLSPVESVRILTPAWSLSLEMQFYLVAPFFLWLLRRRPLATVAVALAINAMANHWWGFYERQGTLAQYFFPSILPSRIFLFGFGAACCMAVVEHTSRRWMISGLWCVGASMLLGWRSFAACTFLAVVVVTGILSTGSLGRMIRHLSSFRAVHALAEWSYSIYLFHMFALAMASHLLSGRLPPDCEKTQAYFHFAALSVLITLALALVIHYLVERPGREWGRRISARLISHRREREPIAGVIVPRI